MDSERMAGMTLPLWQTVALWAVGILGFIIIVTLTVFIVVFAYNYIKVVRRMIKELFDE